MRGGSLSCGFGGRGGYARGGYTAARRSFSHDDLYKDHPVPPQAGAGGGYPAGYEAGYPGSGAGGYPGYGLGAYEVEPSRQIMVCNVSRPVLPSL